MATGTIAINPGLKAISDNPQVPQIPLSHVSEVQHTLDLLREDQRTQQIQS